MDIAKTLTRRTMLKAGLAAGALLPVAGMVAGRAAAADLPDLDITLTGIPTGPASDAALPEARGSRSSFAVEVNRSGTASWSVPMT